MNDRDMLVSKLKLTIGSLELAASSLEKILEDLTNVKSFVMLKNTRGKEDFSPKNWAEDQPPITSYEDLEDQA